MYYLDTAALFVCHRRLYDQVAEWENRLGTHKQLFFIHFDFSFRRAKLVSIMYHLNTEIFYTENIIYGKAKGKKIVVYIIFSLIYLNKYNNKWCHLLTSRI